LSRFAGRVAKVNDLFSLFMPGDSVHVITGDSFYLISEGDTLLKFRADEHGHAVEHEPEVPGGWPVAFPFVAFGCVFVITFFIKWVRRGLNRHKAYQAFVDNHATYNNILDRFNPYYHGLDKRLRQHFLRRTLNFMTAKRFRYVEMEGEEHMPLLISAAAVQLTFGLDNYMLDHFHTIYIVKSDYNYGLYNVPFQGHVNKDGIYLSWSNFLRAFETYNDGDNVGLHEMAHALSYVNFIADDGSDNGFKERFVEFSRTGRAVFREVQDGRVTLLGNYAATNYEEFWAVCVENFFERPNSFRQQLPSLYNAMCKLLNQDMLAPGLFLKPVDIA
jgi:Mlc titration factor MtfA (ptsG expression regulator)